MRNGLVHCAILASTANDTFRRVASRTYINTRNTPINMRVFFYNVQNTIS